MSAPQPAPTRTTGGAVPLHATKLVAGGKCQNASRVPSVASAVAGRNCNDYRAFVRRRPLARELKRERDQFVTPEQVRVPPAPKSGDSDASAGVTAGKQGGFDACSIASLPQSVRCATASRAGPGSPGTVDAELEKCGRIRKNPEQLAVQRSAVSRRFGHRSVFQPENTRDKPGQARASPPPRPPRRVLLHHHACVLDVPMDGPRHGVKRTGERGFGAGPWAVGFGWGGAVSVVIQKGSARGNVSHQGGGPPVFRGVGVRFGAIASSVSTT